MTLAKQKIPAISQAPALSKYCPGSWSSAKGGHAQISGGAKVLIEINNFQLVFKAALPHSTLLPQRIPEVVNFFLVRWPGIESFKASLSWQDSGQKYGKMKQIDAGTEIFPKDKMFVQ